MFYQFVAVLRQKIESIPRASATHGFLRRLDEEGGLVRCYTQNIDGLESRAGLVTELTEETADADSGPGRRCAVVQLHGDVGRVRCTTCAYGSTWSEEGLAAAMEGRLVPCPDCTADAQRRKAQTKRPRQVGALRPDVLLYGEQHPRDTLLQSVLRQDLDGGASVLLIMGTSLKVPGCKGMVKDFVKEMRKGGRGRVVCVNPTAPARSEWRGFIDDWVAMECDAWVKLVRARWDGSGAAGADDEEAAGGQEGESDGRRGSVSPGAYDHAHYQ